MPVPGVALILAVPRLRAGLRPDDFKVRTVAGAVVGATMAVLAAMNDDPDADLGPLTDMALANLESGLTL
jgi:MftR C-terminal domain